jgi:hypothetical protein
MIIDSKLILKFLPEKIYQIADIDNITISKKFIINNNSFDSEFFILSMVENPKNIELEENKKILNRLCKKVDVQKKIVKHYTKDMSQIIDSTIIEPKILILLMIIYLNLAQKDANIKFLNSVLKILDINIIPELNCPKFLSIWAENLVEELI